MKTAALLCKLIHFILSEGKRKLYCNSIYETEAYGTCPLKSCKFLLHSVLSLSPVKWGLVEEEQPCNNGEFNQSPCIGKLKLSLALNRKGLHCPDSNCLEEKIS